MNESDNLVLRFNHAAQKYDLAVRAERAANRQGIEALNEMEKIHLQVRCLDLTIAEKEALYSRLESIDWKSLQEPVAT